MKRALKVLGLVLLVLLLLCALFIAVMYFHNKHSLKKEAQLIHRKGQLVTVEGGSMNIYTEGQGDRTLVFMAGANTPAVIYDFKPLYSKLTDRYRIVVIEKFGYGYSDDMDGERCLSTLLRQDRLALEKAGIEGPYVLCPHSASGLEAIRWAQLYPEEVEAIIGLDMAVPEQLDLMMGDLSQVKTSTYEETAADEEFYDFWMYDMGAYRLFNFGKVFPASCSDDLTQEEQAEYRAITYSWYSRFYKTAMFREGVLTEAQLSDMRDLHDSPEPDVPTLLFISSDEATFSAMLGENGLQRWRTIHENYASRLTYSKQVQLDCGHFVHAEDPDTVSREIDTFLTQLGSK